MCRSKCFTARIAVPGEGSSPILKAEDSWEVRKENPFLPHWGARTYWGNSQVVTGNIRILPSLSPLVPWCVEKGPDLGVHLLAEAKNEVWGLSGASSWRIVPISDLSCTSPLACTCLLLDCRRKETAVEFSNHDGGGDQGVLTGTVISSATRF